MAIKVVTLLGKPDCGLCDGVKQVIAQVAIRRRFRLEIRNILDDPADLQAYHLAIPVVLVDGREIARYRLTAYELEAALAE